MIKRFRWPVRREIPGRPESRCAAPSMEPALAVAGK